MTVSHVILIGFAGVVAIGVFAFYFDYRQRKRAKCKKRPIVAAPGGGRDA